MGYVVGVIGAGRIGRIHTENLMRMHDVDVTRVADPRGDECAEWASSLGLDGVAKGPEAILDDPSIKAVFIFYNSSVFIKKFYLKLNIFNI